MKSMKLTGIRQMEMMDVPAPSLNDTKSVLIRMRAVGVCGSDIHYYVDGRIGDQVVKPPFTVGHEGTGIVEQIGSDVTRVKVGDRVAIDPAMPCWNCDQCKNGRAHTCRKLLFLGCPGQAEGCLSEYIVMPETSCFPIPGSMTFDEAALVEPLSIGVYAVSISIPMQDAVIGILGSGPIGLSVMLAALEQGAKKVYITDKLDERLQLSKKAGAYWTGNPIKEDIVSNINRMEPDLLDAVFECCGQQEAIDQSIEILKPGGKLLLVGIPSVDTISFDISRFRRKEICIQNVRRQNECVNKAIKLIDDRKVDAGIMITHHFTFEQTKDAFDMVAGYNDGVVKAIISFM